MEFLKVPVKGGCEVQGEEAYCGVFLSFEKNIFYKPNGW